MALVPFRVSGPAASQQLDSQLLQVGPYSLLLHQRPQASGNTTHLGKPLAQQQQQQQGGEVEQDRAQQQDFKDRLPNVGFVLWQSGFVLADFLLQRLPQLQNHSSGSSSSSYWAGVRVLELGCGGGTVGMFLALAGAQVVLTDQSHILSLTNENLLLNFPATAAVGGSSLQQSCQGTRSKPQQLSPAAAAVVESPTAAAGVVAVNGHSSPAQEANHNSSGSSVKERPTSVSNDHAATGDPQSIQQQHQQPQQPEKWKATSWDVFGPGPLVVEYVWGEPQQQLQSRVAAAAAVRLAQGATRHCCRAAGEGATTTAAAPALQKGATELDLLLQQLASAEYDVIVGGDLLYYSDSYQVLLDSLDSLSAPHTQVYLSYRCRDLGEEQFKDLAAEAGWLVQVANSSLLHPEFQGGEYQLLCLSRIE